MEDLENEGKKLRFDVIQKAKVIEEYKEENGMFST